MFKLGQRSLQNIEKIDDYLQEIVKKAITLSKSDFGILNNGGLRTAEMQNAIFKKGNSRCDGYKKKSYHQTGKAVDCVPYVDGKYTWSNKKALLDVYNAMLKAEKILKLELVIPKDLEIYHGLLWNYIDLNRNNRIDIDDQLGWDCVHHEIREHM